MWFPPPPHPPTPIRRQIMTDHSELGMKDFRALQTAQKRQKQPPINLIDANISFHWKKIFRKKTLKWLLTPACLRWSSKRGRSGRGEVKSHLSPSSPRIPVPRTLKRRLCAGGLWTLFRVWLTLYWYFKLNKFEIYSPGFSSATGLAFASSISLMHSALSSSDSHKFLFSSLWNRKRKKG